MKTKRKFIFGKDGRVINSYLVIVEVKDKPEKKITRPEGMKC